MGASASVHGDDTPRHKNFREVFEDYPALKELYKRSTSTAAVVIQCAARMRFARATMVELQEDAVDARALVVGEGGRAMQRAECSIDTFASTVDNIVHIDKRIPFVRATTETARASLVRLVNYTPGHTIRASNDEDCKPEKLRLALVDALTTGSTLLIDMDGDDDVDGDGDAPDVLPMCGPGFFPAELFTDPAAIHRPEIYGPLIGGASSYGQEMAKVLGVRLGSTKEEITKAYRKLARKNHPDRGGDADTFIRINTAFEVLTGAALPPMNDDANEEPVTPNVNFKVMILSSRTRSPPTDVRFNCTVLKVSDGEAGILSHGIMFCGERGRAADLIQHHGSFRTMTPQEKAKAKLMTPGHTQLTEWQAKQAVWLVESWFERDRFMSDRVHEEDEDEGKHREMVNGRRLGSARRYLRLQLFSAGGQLNRILDADQKTKREAILEQLNEKCEKMAADEQELLATLDSFERTRAEVKAKVEEKKKEFSVLAADRNAREKMDKEIAKQERMIARMKENFPNRLKKFKDQLRDSAEAREKEKRLQRRNGGGESPKKSKSKSPKHQAAAAAQDGWVNVTYNIYKHRYPIRGGKLVGGAKALDADMSFSFAMPGCFIHLSTVSDHARLLSHDEGSLMLSSPYVREEPKGEYVGLEDGMQLKAYICQTLDDEKEDEEKRRYWAHEAESIAEQLTAEEEELLAKAKKSEDYIHLFRERMPVMEAELEVAKQARDRIRNAIRDGYQTMSRLSEEVSNKRMKEQTAIGKATEAFAKAEAEAAAAEKAAAEEAEKEALLDANGKGGLYELHRAVYTTKHAPEESRDMCELAITGKLTEVKALLAQGVSPESTDGSGHTALSDAACGGHDDIVALLLALGADPNTASDRGTTPLGRAAWGSHLSTMKLLLEAGAEPSRAWRSMDHSSAEACALIREYSSESGNAQGSWSMSSVADRRRRARRVELESQLDEFAKRWTAAESKAYRQVAAEANLMRLADGGDAELLRTTLELILQENRDQPDPTARLDVTADSVRDKVGRTLLAVAAWRGHHEVVEFLLTEWKSRAGPSEEEQEAARFFKVNTDHRFGPFNRADGWTAFSIAAFCGHAKCAELLRLNGANP